MTQRTTNGAGPDLGRDVRDPTGPAVIFAPDVDSRELTGLQLALRRERFYVVTLSGMHYRDPEHVFAALDAAFGFPGYFGRNWDAVLDCLTDLSWLGEATGYCSFLRGSSKFRTATPDVYDKLVGVFELASDRWRSERIPFKFICC